MCVPSPVAPLLSSCPPPSKAAGRGRIGRVSGITYHPWHRSRTVGRAPATQTAAATTGERAGSNLVRRRGGSVGTLPGRSPGATGLIPDEMQCAVDLPSACNLCATHLLHFGVCRRRLSGGVNTVCRTACSRPAWWCEHALFGWSGEEGECVFTLSLMRPPCPSGSRGQYAVIWAGMHHRRASFSGRPASFLMPVAAIASRSASNARSPRRRQRTSRSAAVASASSPSP